MLRAISVVALLLTSQSSLAKKLIKMPLEELPAQPHQIKERINTIEDPHNLGSGKETTICLIII